MRWDEALGPFDELAAENHHFEMYWFPHTERHANQAQQPHPRPARAALAAGAPGWTTSSSPTGSSAGSTAWATADRAWCLGWRQVAGRALTERRYSDVPHRVFTSPRRVVFREMEYAVPREAGLQALRDVRALVEQRDWRISFPVEIRVTPADDVPLSTSSGRDSVYLAFHMNARTDHTAYFGGVEHLLRGYDGRPHWGKLHTRTAADLEPAYPRWHEFTDLRDKLDPDRLFGNEHLRRVLGS